ncbi:hypothetical protein DFP73DRAFT_539677, partial [Morchella snyderi]
MMLILSSPYPPELRETPPISSPVFSPSDNFRATNIITITCLTYCLIPRINMSHPYSSDSHIHSEIARGLRDEIPRATIDSRVAPDPQHPARSKEKNVYEVEEKAVEKPNAEEFELRQEPHAEDALRSRGRVLDILQAYGLDQKQLRDMTDGYGDYGIHRFLNESNNSVLARSQPGFYNRDPVDFLLQGTTSTKSSHSNRSWVEVPGSPRQDEEFELLCTNSSFYMVPEESQGDEYIGVVN